MLPLPHGAARSEGNHQNAGRLYPVDNQLKPELRIRPKNPVTTKSPTDTPAWPRNKKHRVSHDPVESQQCRSRVRMEADNKDAWLGREFGVDSAVQSKSGPYRVRQSPPKSGQSARYYTISTDIGWLADQTL